MTRQLSTPIMIDENGQHEPLTRLQLEDRDYDESWLQQLLFDHASLIPVDELEPAFADHVAVCRELPTPAGPVDLLYMNPRGFITLVETKLWRNPDARRSVVAQVIDYTKELARWTYEDLAQAATKASGGGSTDPLISLFGEHEDFQEAEFIDSVTRNLRLGRFLLLIVGDGVREGVEHMVEYLQETPQLHFSLGLIEMGLYRTGAEGKGPLLVQPRILARTQEITRAVVEIKTNVKHEDINVRIPAGTESKKLSGRNSLTEDAFFEELERNSDAKVVEFAQWVLENAEDNGLEIVWGDAGPLVKWVDDQTGDSFTFGQLTKDGTLGYTVRLWGRCRKWGLSVDIARDYFDAVAELVPGAVRKQFRSPKAGDREMLVMGAHGKQGDRPPLAPMADHKEQWFEIIQKTVAKLEIALSDKV